MGGAKRCHQLLRGGTLSQNTSCGKNEPPEVPNDWESNQRGRGTWSLVIPCAEMLLLRENWSIPSIYQTSSWHGMSSRHLSIYPFAGRNPTISESGESFKFHQ